MKLSKILGIAALTTLGTILPYNTDKKDVDNAAVALGMTFLPTYAWVKSRERSENN